jgi:hypothetical protein
MKTLAATLLLTLMAIAAFAADIDGKWTASVPGRDGQPQETTFTFKAAGNKLTGTISSARGSLDIQDGKIEGDKVSFVISFGEIRIVHTGKISGNEIQFERKREGGDRAQQFTAKKQ